MSFKLDKPYNNKQYADFIVTYNHNKGFKIEETDTAVYALEADEIMTNGVPTQNPNYKQEILETKKEQKQQEVNKAKETAFSSGFLFEDNLYDCDDRAQIRLSAKLATVKENDTITWLDYNYKAIEFTYEKFLLLCETATQFITGIEFLTGLYLEAIEKAITIDELEKIIPNYSQESITNFFESK